MALRRQRQAIQTIEEAGAGVALRSAPAGAILVLWDDVDETPAAEARSGYLSEETVALYMAAYERDDGLPHPRLWRDADGTLRLGDGRHRWHAHIRLFGENTPLLCQVSDGGYRDAWLDAAGSNIAHGLPATTEQRLANLRRLAEDEEWASWSARAMARAVGLSPTTVSKYLADWQVERERVTYVDRHGNESTMDTSGQRQAAEERRERLRQERRERQAAHRPAGGSKSLDVLTKSSDAPIRATQETLCKIVRQFLLPFGDDDAAALAWLRGLQADEVDLAIESAKWISHMQAHGYEAASLERWAIAVTEVGSALAAKLDGDAPADDGWWTSMEPHLVALGQAHVAAFQVADAIGRPELADAVSAAVDALVTAWREVDDGRSS